jgi:hypothetical protein
VDGFLIGGLSTSTIGQTGQASLEFPYAGVTGVPELYLNTETDESFRKPQPESDTYRIWEVAGATHIDRVSEDYLAATYSRDYGKPEPPTPCEKPPIGEIPYVYVQNAAMDWLVRWAQTGKTPPAQPSFEYDSNGDIVRDTDGNALGGIRLPQHAVPTATNTREFCGLAGAHIPFSAARLRQLYPTHDDYVEKVKAAADADVRTGVLLPADATTIIAEADAADIPPAWAEH